MKKNVAIDEKLQRKLKIESSKKGITLFELLNSVIENYFKKGDKSEL